VLDGRQSKLQQEMSFDPKKVVQDQRRDQLSESWFLTKIHEFNQAHNRLKHTVHTTWRYPLPPWGRAVMACVYFSIPVVAGYYVSTYAAGKSEATIEERFGGVSKSNIQGFGDKIVVHDESGERTQKVGAGGWGGGVRLATSDEETQEINRVNLERFLKKQRRLRRKRERETQQNEDDANS